MPEERTEFGHRHDNLSKLQETMKNREAWRAAAHGVSKSPTRLRDWTPTSRESSACWWGLLQHHTNELLILTAFQDNTLYLVKALLPYGIAIVTDKSIIYIYVYIYVLLSWDKKNLRAILLCCSVTQSCLTLCDPMDCSTAGFPVLHHLPESVQILVHWVGDTI